MEFVETPTPRAVIKVVGVGGCGGNVVRHLLARQLEGVSYAAVNTDAQALAQIADEGVVRVQIGAGVTNGLGAGARPEVAKEAARADSERLRELARGCDMVFVTAGMGKGTGTGAAPIMAEMAREAGALTVAVVTRPFAVERRERVADEGIDNLAKHVDSLIVVPNQKLLDVLEKHTLIKEAYAASNEVLQNAVLGIAEVITKPGEMNLDFNDVRTVMSEMGMAVIGSATESGVDRANRAALAAVQCPLIEDIDLSNARGLLVNLTVNSANGTITELDEAVKAVQEHMNYEGEVLAGLVYDDTLGEAARVTVVVTGVQRAGEAAQRREPKLAAIGGGGPISEPQIQAPGRAAAAAPEVFSSARRRRELQRLRQEVGGDENDVPAILRQQLS